jgi:hypothetical protein
MRGLQAVVRESVGLRAVRCRDEAALASGSRAASQQRAPGRPLAVCIRTRLALTVQDARRGNLSLSLPLRVVPARAGLLAVPDALASAVAVGLGNAPRARGDGKGEQGVTHAPDRASSRLSCQGAGV